MFYIILVIAGIVLAANRKQQAATADVPVSVAHDDTTILPHFLDIAIPEFRRDYLPLAKGPGIGAPLSANNPAFSDIIVSGPTIYRPDKGGAPVAAPAGGGTSAGAAPSATGSGGVGPAPPRSPYIPNTL